MDKPAPKKRGRKPILDAELVAAALVSLHGNISAVATRFGVHRSSVQELIDKRPNLRQIMRDAREGLLDHAESALLRAVLGGEAWAVCFALKTQGRQRGYVERGADANVSAEQIASFIAAANKSRANRAKSAPPARAAHEEGEGAE